MSNAAPLVAGPEARQRAAGARDVRAAAVLKKGAPLEFINVSLEPPRPDEVLVRVVAAGICHTDLTVRDQNYETPLPMVLGHEGSGVVEAVGEAVKKVEPGDRVVLTFMSCGICPTCATGDSAYCHNLFALNFGGGRLDGSNAADSEQGARGHFFGQSSFATYALAHERNVVKVPGSTPLERLGPLGCGVQTGAGAAINSVEVTAGSTVAVFGAGSVGLSAVMGAQIAGAARVIVVDVQDQRLKIARELGADDVINAEETDPVDAVRSLTGAGVDFSLETSGVPAVVRQAIEALAPTGVCGLVGAPPMGAEADFDINDVLTAGKTIRGVVEGDSAPDVFIPALIDLHERGRFPFDRLIRFYDFDDINTAIADMESGETLKPVLRIASV